MGLHNIKFLFDNYQRNSSSLFGFTVKDLNCFFFCFKATYFAEANKKNQKEEKAEETKKVSSEQK